MTSQRPVAEPALVDVSAAGIAAGIELKPDGSSVSLGSDGGGSSSAPRLSVVVPMYQEAERIGGTLAEACGYLAVFDGGAELLLIDDGSTDRTVAAARDGLAEYGEALDARVIELGENRGKGAAVRAGLAQAAGDWVLMMDADHATPVQAVERLFAAAAGRQDIGLVCGSRAVDPSLVDARLSRYVSGLMFRTAIGVLGLGSIRDTQCGFKLYRRELAQRLAAASVEDGFAFDIEHIAMAEQLGVGIAEVGTPWQHKDGGTVSVWRDGPKMLSASWRIRKRLRDEAWRVRAQRVGAPADVAQ